MIQISPPIFNFISNPKISAKAKTLLMIILSDPKFFQDINTKKEEFLLDCCKERHTAVQSGIKELEENHLLKKQIVRNKKGKGYIKGARWYIILEEQ